MCNVDEIEDIAKRINSAQQVKVLVDMGYHLEPFAIKSVFLDKEVRHRRLAVVGKNLLTPDACGSVEIHRDKGPGFARPVWLATEVSVNDFLGLCTGLLVGDVLDAHVGGLVLDRDWRRSGSGWGGGATVVADWDESEDAGTIEPAIDDMTDVPLEGRTEDEEPRLTVRDEPC